MFSVILFVVFVSSSVTINIRSYFVYFFYFSFVILLINLLHLPGLELRYFYIVFVMSIQLVFLNSLVGEVGTVLNKVSIILTFVCLFMFFGNIGYSVNDEGRFTLGGDNENYYGIKMCVLMAVNLFNLKLGQLLKFVTSLLLMYLIFLSGSKAAVLASIIIVVYYLWVQKKLYYLLPIALVLFFEPDSVSFFQSKEVFSRYSLFAEESLLENDRVSLIEFFVDVFMRNHNIIIGLGDHEFSELGRLYFNNEFTPHNIFVELYLRYGLSGLLVFIVLLGLLFYRARFNNLSLCLFVCLFVLIFFGQFLNSKLAWFLVFITHTLPFRREIV